jgi:hypothetical protein
MPDVPFPLLALPAWLRDMASAVASSAQADPSMAGAAALGVVSASVGRKGFVLVGRRRFPLHVWITAIGESGDGKSAVFNELIAPLRAVQSLREEDARGPEPSRPGRNIYERMRERWDVGDEPPPPPAARFADALGVVREALAGNDDRPLRLLLVDVTPTALIDLLAAQVTGTTLASPEGGFESWLSQESAVASQAAGSLNQVWDGEDFALDRLDRNLTLVRPALTLLIGMQPEIFARFSAVKALRSRGFTLRFLFVRSEPLRRSYPAPEVPVAIRETYDANIYRLVSLPGWPPTEPVRLRTSEGAARMNADFMNQLEARIAVGGDLRHGRAYGRRFGANLPRIAGLLHLARHAANQGDAVVEQPVDEETMAAAVEIATYFLEEGVATLTEQPRPSAGTSLVEAIERLLREPPSWVGTPEELVVALERVTPIAERSDWPRGANNVMRDLRARLVDLDAKAITLNEDRTNLVRMVMLARRERPPGG